jgi:hypothetical protein
MTLSCSASIYFANDFPNDDIIGLGDLMAEKDALSRAQYFLK